jgi:hypothetical protein
MTLLSALSWAFILDNLSWQSSIVRALALTQWAPASEYSDTSLLKSVASANPDKQIKVEMVMNNLMVNLLIVNGGSMNREKLTEQASNDNLFPQGPGRFLVVQTSFIAKFRIPN